MNLSANKLLLSIVLSGSALMCAAQERRAQAIPAPATAGRGNTFANPLLRTGPDPWVVWWKGFYYYSNSSGTNLTLRKTADITDLRDAEKKAVWTPEPGHPWSQPIVGSGTPSLGQQMVHLFFR